MHLPKIITFLLIFFYCGQGCSPKKTVSTNPDLATYLKSDASKWNVADSFIPLLPSLDSIFLDDQRYRSVYDNNLYFNNAKLQNRLDSINAQKVKKILSKYGWLGVQQIGARTINLLFVLQHSRKEDKEYFLPILLDAYRKGTLACSSLYLFIDRYLMGKQEQQLFGTQMISRKGRLQGGIENIYPIFEPAKIEYRWALYGDGFFKYKSYIKTVDKKIDWDAAEHTKYVLINAKQFGFSLDSTNNVYRILHLLDSCKALIEKGKSNKT